MKSGTSILPPALAFAMLVIVAYAGLIFADRAPILVVLAALPMVFVVPGVLLLAVLYPELWSARHRKTWAARRFATQGPVFILLIAVGLSLTLVALLALLLELLPFPVNRISVVTTIVAANVLLALVALGRWVDVRNKPSAFEPGEDAEDDATTAAGRGRVPRLPVLAVMAVVVMIAAAALATPPREGFTEFYIMGDTGNAICLPDRFDDGYTSTDPRCRATTGNVTIGIQNQEGVLQHYAALVDWNMDPESPLGALRDAPRVAVWTVRASDASDGVFDQSGEGFQHEMVLEVPPPPEAGWNRLTFRLFNSTVGPIDPNDPGGAGLLPLQNLVLWIFAEEV